MKLRTTTFACAALTAVGLLAAGCRMDMQDQPRYEPDQASAFFADGRADRPLPNGVVPRGSFREDVSFTTGIGPDGQPLARLPVPVDAALLARGQERFDIYCAPCHGRVGDGNGMIVQRGYRRPASLHEERLRNSPAGHFFDVMTRGFGVMPSYAAQVPVQDRWAIVAYIRALQLSQSFPADDLDAEERAQLAAAAQGAAAKAEAEGQGAH